MTIFFLALDWILFVWSIFVKKVGSELSILIITLSQFSVQYPALMEIWTSHDSLTWSGYQIENWNEKNPCSCFVSTLSCAEKGADLRLLSFSFKLKWQQTISPLSPTYRSAVTYRCLQDKRTTQTTQSLKFDKFFSCNLNFEGLQSRLWF